MYSQYELSRVQCECIIPEKHNSDRWRPRCPGGDRGCPGGCGLSDHPAKPPGTGDRLPGVQETEDEEEAHSELHRRGHHLQRGEQGGLQGDRGECGAAAEQ